MRRAAGALVLGLVMATAAHAAERYTYVDAPTGGRIAGGDVTENDSGWRGVFQSSPLDEAVQIVGLGLSQPGLRIDAIGQRIGIQDPNGRLYWIAGTGRWGFRDGPGERAMFAMGGSGYPSASGGFDSRGNAYVTDGYNGRIRKLTRDQAGRWMVTTAAGGGTSVLGPGQSGRGPAVRLNGPLALMIDAQDNVWFLDGWVYKLAPDGTLTAHALTDPSDRKRTLVVHSMSKDRAGNMYFLDRNNQATRLWKLLPDGKVQWLAGIGREEWEARQAAKQPIPIDGPVDKCSFWAAGAVVPARDGSAIYLSAGDETNVRRVKDGRCSTLMPDGTFREIQVRNGGLYTGWPVYVDDEGRIYTTKVPWIPPDPGQWAIFRILLPEGVQAPTPGRVRSPGSGSSVQPAVANTLTIREVGGVTTENYPVQLGRPFRQGEILGVPQAVVGGVPVPTQANVKTRWVDGSAQHAILSFLIPALRAKASVTVTFRDEARSATPSQPLPPIPAVPATIALGDRGTASAQAMIDAGKVHKWLEGAIAPTWIVADHEGKAFDLGSFRPIFHVTHWPAIGKTRVRFIGEISDTEKMQDLRYTVTLPTGETAAVVHQAGARWTREAWLGGAPPPIAIDHNLAYLASTRLVPNYDTSIRVDETALVDAAMKWRQARKGFFEPGNWTPAMGTAGGRPDIGPYPTWTVLCLYTGDPRPCAQAFGNADLAAAWPVHFREGRRDKFVDHQRTVPGLGRVISIVARPTLHLLRPYATGKGTDHIPAVGPTDLTANAWRPELAHQPDPVSVQYLLTGDYWYLEELWFWAAYGAGYPAGGTQTTGCGRGPTGAEGGFPGFASGCATIRSQAWGLRTRVHAAAYSPDDTPEKAYFTHLVDDALCIWEGGRGITNTPCAGKPTYEWGRVVDARTIWKGMPPAPLHHWEVGGQAFSPVDPARASTAYAPWQQSFLLFSLGRAVELGFPAGRLLSWLGSNTIGMLTDPAMNPHYIASPMTPVLAANSTFLANWASVRAAYVPSFDPEKDFRERLGNLDHGYSIVALPAIAALAKEPGGVAAWAWAKRHIRDAAAQGFAANPKWAILPRD